MQILSWFHQRRGGGAVCDVSALWGGDACLTRSNLQKDRGENKPGVWPKHQNPIQQIQPDTSDPEQAPPSGSRLHQHRKCPF